MTTELPWCQSDSIPNLLFHDLGGLIDFNKPVAQFINPDDAALTVSAFRKLVRAKELRQRYLDAAKDSTFSPDARALYELVAADLKGILS